MFANAFKFDRRFWLANLMELFERWAYYGVRVGLSIYIVSAASIGGLEFTHIQKGQIYSAWALIQSILPILTGGYADRYGYRRIVLISVLAKVAGYILMATQHSYWGFLGGCVLLASGTAIFKPAVQGTIASAVNNSNSSFGWGIFYWLVNVGGFLGSWTAGYLQMYSWTSIFYANAFIVSLNLLILIFCLPNEATLARAEERKNANLLLNKDEPDSNEKKSDQGVKNSENQIVNKSSNLTSLWKIPIETVKEMFEPRLISFLLIYSGYWAAYNQIFDTLPNFLDDWVHSSSFMVKLGEITGNKEWLNQGLAGVGIPNEWVLSINCLTFIILMLPLSWMVKNANPIFSMIGGIVLVALGTLIFGSSQLVSWSIAGIVIFSIGEMGAGPKMREYLGLISPKGKESRYMGYANLPEAIGWGFGSLVAGYWYEIYSDKHTLAKNLLRDSYGWTSARIASLSKEEILPTLQNLLHMNKYDLSNYLWVIGHPDKIWPWFVSIALTSAVGLVIHQYVFKPKGFNTLKDTQNAPELLI